MFKCLECGHIFDDGEEVHWQESYGEHFAGCPLCRGAYAETYTCKECGSEHFEDELYYRLCKDCLEEKITYNNFFEYLTADENRLTHFMFDAFFESSVPDVISKKLMDTLAHWYRLQMADDQMCHKEAFLNLCKKYVMEDDGECGRYDYAEWLSQRRMGPRQ